MSTGRASWSTSAAPCASPRRRGPASSRCPPPPRRSLPDHVATGSRIVRGTAPLSAQGTWQLEARLPEGADLGTYTLDARLAERTGSGAAWAASLRTTAGTTFQVQEYRAPDFEVKVHAPAGARAAGQRGPRDDRGALSVRQRHGRRPRPHHGGAQAERLRAAAPRELHVTARWSPAWRARSRLTGTGGGRYRIEDELGAGPTRASAPGPRSRRGDARLDAHGKLGLRFALSRDEDTPARRRTSRSRRRSPTRTGRLSRGARPSRRTRRPCTWGSARRRGWSRQALEQEVQLVAVTAAGERQAGVAARVELLRRRVEARWERDPRRSSPVPADLDRRGDLGVHGAHLRRSRAVRGAPPRPGLYVLRPTAAAGGGRRARTEVVLFATGPVRPRGNSPVPAWPISCPTARPTRSVTPRASSSSRRSRAPRRSCRSRPTASSSSTCRTSRAPRPAWPCRSTRALLPSVTLRVVLLRGRVPASDFGVPEADARARTSGAPPSRRARSCSTSPGRAASST